MNTKGIPPIWRTALLHLLIWASVWYSLRYFAIPTLTKDNVNVITHASVAVFMESIFVFYVVGYLAFPWFLYTKKIFLLLVTLVCLFQVIYLINYFEFKHLVSISDSKITGNPLYVTRVWDQYMSRKPLWACLTDFLMAYLNYSWSFYYVTPLLAIKTTIDVVRSRTKNLILERDRFKLEVENLSLATQRLSLEKDYLILEVNFLRTQISPHFLFNTLNAIYNRIVHADELAAELISKIAHLMRYTLYFADKERVAIEDEVRYLRNYIDLERTRFGEDVDIRFETNVDDNAMQLAPLLLISFVENAFKHGMSLAADDPFVHVYLSLKDGHLIFQIKNSIDPHESDTSLTANSTKKNGGIGLENISKRLVLLYSNKHELLIQSSDNVFIVDLAIDIS